MKWWCDGLAGITHRPDTASEDALLRKICSVRATADTSFDSTDSLDSSGVNPDVAAAAAADFMRHSVDSLPMSSNDPLYAPPDFLRPVSGPAVPAGCRTKFKYVSFLRAHFFDVWIRLGTLSQSHAVTKFSDTRKGGKHCCIAT